MKAIAEIAKTKSIVQKENTLIDIKVKLNLQSLDPCTHKSGLTTCFDYRLQQKHPNGVDSLQ